MIFRISSTDGKNKKRTISRAENRRNFATRNRDWSWLNAKFFKLVAFALLVGAFIGLIVYVLFFSTFLKISKIEISGATSVGQESIRQDVEAKFSGKYLNWIERNNFLWIDTEELQHILMDKYEKIKNVRVARVFPDKISIVVEERVPGIVLCSGDSGCFVVDASGFVYMRFNQSSQDNQLVGLMRLTDKGNKSIKFKESFLDEAYVQAIIGTQKGLRDELGIDVALDCQTPQLISGDIRVMTNEGWWVYFDSNKAIEKELEMLRAVLREKIDKLGQRSELEYIDLRATNKVYYKLRNQEMMTEEVASPVVVPPVLESKKSDKKKH